MHAVYMGGGTPTALEADDIRRHPATRPGPCCLLANDSPTITAEGRLSSFGPDKMEACFDGGANRFSFGVHSFDTDIRRATGPRFALGDADPSA